LMVAMLSTVLQCTKELAVLIAIGPKN
jgi:hypothetical protein